MASPEQQARIAIDQLLTAAGWAVQDVKQADLRAARGVALREFPLNEGYGFADYLLYVDGKAAGVIEAKKQGATLTGVEAQSGRYAQGLPASLPAWRRLALHQRALQRAVGVSRAGHRHQQDRSSTIVSPFDNETQA